MRIALLAGGTGGAKLAAGMQEEIGSDLTVIANTGDDIETLGVHVSPDPDLVTYWLSGEIDEERGWGLRDDSFTVFERLTKLGAPSWFGLSDRDLAACLYRRQFLEEGGSLTDAQAQIARALGVEARVLPMCEAPVRTKVLTAAGVRGLQEYLIVDRGEPEVHGVELEGIADGRAERRGAGGAARGRGDRDRPLQPGDQHRPDPRRAGDDARRSPPRRARSSRSAPSSPARSSRGRPSASCRPWAGPRPPPASPRSTPA